MGKPMFYVGFMKVMAATLIFLLVSVPGALCQDKGVGQPGYHNQRGIEYFKKGFYDHAPKNQAVEADRNYRLAIREFRAAISKDPTYTEARRNLARVYYLQKNFIGAAEEYQRTTELTPADLDAYVNLALALIELKLLDEAIQALEKAKGQTSDPKVLYTLDAYLAKVRAYQAQEVR